MSVYNYKKYKVALQHDSNKVQGLRTGDIVRRQYLDGATSIYSLMCVLSYGQEEAVDEDTNEIVQRSYFIGALLEGDVPSSEQLLDFVRVTSLFDDARSGALYLTASDEQSPYMDVIDGLAKDFSLSYPENIATEDYADAESQYVVSGEVVGEYIEAVDDNSRVLHLTRSKATDTGFLGIRQDFYKYVQNPNRVLVSYKAKASRAVSCTVSLGYQDETRIDGTETYTVSTDWQYKLHVITVDYSGRYLRTLKMDLSAMSAGDEVWIADFNIVLLSTVSNFGDASKLRIGKLAGITDPVFGQLEGYGSYMQKLYASQSAHISGTLTAGDENGFAATFYAGKIHRNVFVNSLDVNFISSVDIDSSMDNPTGMGNVYKFSDDVTMQAQDNEWLMAHFGERYTFSFWVYADKACQLSVSQNGKVVNTIQILETSALSWRRYKSTFDLQPPQGSDGMEITVAPVVESGTVQLWLVAPQLEAGMNVTQYQPTDNVLNDTEEYGAWFNRGGIGGTIQNPLLRLNYDGEGSVGTRTNSLLLKTDGSGYLANTNIKWDEQGNVTFGKNVTMAWDNLDTSAQENLVSKSVRITGEDTFTVVKDTYGNFLSTEPSGITLTLEEENISSTSSQRQWYYLSGSDYASFEGGNGKEMTIYPFDGYWNDSNSLTVRCVVNVSGSEYAATFTVRRQYVEGYTVVITSSKGTTYKNGVCETTLTANVYYQGKLLDPSYVEEHFTFLWHKYDLPETAIEPTGWYEAITDEDGNVVQAEIDVTKQSITLNYEISGQDYFTCELLEAGGAFPYAFPLVFDGDVFPYDFSLTF